MPEMRMSICWPDGARENCYSPSRVLKEYFRVGQSYALADFRDRSRTALTIASDRVQAKFGFPCQRAADQLARIEERCRAFVSVPGAQVRVEAFHE
jgi:uncharacterized repeat protein (TIGR04042 family)